MAAGVATTLVVSAGPAHAAAPKRDHQVDHSAPAPHLVFGHKLA